MRGLTRHALRGKFNLLLLPGVVGTPAHLFHLRLTLVSHTLVGLALPHSLRVARRWVYPRAWLPRLLGLGWRSGGLLNGPGWRGVAFSRWMRCRAISNAFGHKPGQAGRVIHRPLVRVAQHRVCLTNQLLLRKGRSISGNIRMKFF